MSKEEFLAKLQAGGYKADMQGSIPTVYTDDLSVSSAVQDLAKEVRYNYSFRVKLMHTEQ